MATAIPETDPLSPIGMALRFQVPAKRKRRRPKRVKPIRQPRNIERRYEAEARAAIAESQALIEAEVFPELPELQRQAEAGDPLWPAALAALFAAVAAKWEERAEEFAPAARRAAGEVSAFNRVELTRQLKAITGVELAVDGPRTASLGSAFVEASKSGIKGLGDKQIAELRGIVARALQSGRRAEDVAKEIKERFAINSRRATFIARNELETLYGQLTRDRQTALGITHYIWRTSRDERVRPTHAVLNGTVQGWDSPPLVGGGRRAHPGEDFNCRCTAEPVIPGVTLLAA